MEILNEISLSVQKGRIKNISALVEDALSNGVEARDILNLGLLSGMGEVGEKFKKNEIFVPEVMLAAHTLNKALEGLKPLLVQSGVKPVGKAVICTVQGDRHDIGKNLVKMMMTGVGIEVIDLGVNVGAAQIVEAVKHHNPGIVALSALLTTTMNNQKAIIDALDGAGLRDKVKVMVGGAPVTEEFAKEIGADAYTPDAATAAETAKSFF